MTLLPAADSTNLALRHPTPAEKARIIVGLHAQWGGPTPFDTYVRASNYITQETALARDGGTRAWILTDITLPPDQRPLLNFSMTNRKRALLLRRRGGQLDNSDISPEEKQPQQQSNVIEDVVVQAVASVYCPTENRGRGYASRHMTLLAQELTSSRNSRTRDGDYSKENGGRRCVGTVLYSDIGRDFYARLGWKTHPTNWQLVLPPLARPVETIPEAATAPEVGDDRITVGPLSCRPVTVADIPKLCALDETDIRTSLMKMGTSSDCEVKGDNTNKHDGGGDVVVILPDANQLLWHFEKVDFPYREVVGTPPVVKGAQIFSIGDGGDCQEPLAWAVWIHKFATFPKRHQGTGRTEDGLEGEEDSHTDTQKNTLRVLRLVVRGDESAYIQSPVPSSSDKTVSLPELSESQSAALQAVLQAAQAEAKRWRLDGGVVVWEPSPSVLGALRKEKERKTSGLIDNFRLDERDVNLASELWFDDHENAGQDSSGIVGRSGAATKWLNNEYYAWC